MSRYGRAMGALAASLLLLGCTTGGPDPEPPDG
jgi:hypothetical protein